MAVDYTDAPIRVTYSVKSYTVGVPDGSYVMTHDLDRTPFLDTGDTFQRRGDYGSYETQGEFEMRGRGISCEYNDGSPCRIDRNQPETFKFTIIRSFVETLKDLPRVQVDER